MLNAKLVILRASDKVRCLDSGGLYRRCPKNLNPSACVTECSRSSSLETRVLLPFNSSKLSRRIPGPSDFPTAPARTLPASVLPGFCSFPQPQSAWALLPPSASGSTRTQLSSSLPCPDHL